MLKIGGAMDLGRIFTITQFNKNEQTTWIIDKFYKCIYSNEVYDTVKLGWALSIIEDDTVYPISLFVKDCVLSCDRACEIRKFNKRFCRTSFSLIRQKYVGRGFNADECAKDILLNKIYRAYLLSKTRETNTFVEFDSPYCFKAQSSYSHESDGFGRSVCYYLVGVSVGNSFKIPKC